MNSTDPTNAAPNSRVRTSNAFSDIVSSRRKRRSSNLRHGKIVQDAGRTKLLVDINCRSAAL
jgi:hypothetical protein